MGAVIQLFAAPEPPACTVLTTELACRLGKLNQVCRELRNAGIPPVAIDLDSSTITIARESVPTLVDQFHRRFRGLMSRTTGRFTRHRTEINDVNVVWWSPVKEQDQ